MRKINLPSQGVPVDLPGQVDPLWYEKFEAIARQINTSLTTSSITVGNTAYAPTTGVAKGFTLAGTGTPVIQANLVGGTTATAQNTLDNWRTIADALTKAATNYTDLQTAIAALNTRISALETDLHGRFP